MGTDEVKPQGVVGVLGRPGRRLGLDPGFARLPGGLCPGRVQELAPGDGDQPALRVRRCVSGPRRQRPEQRLLHGVLGRREVCSATDEDTGVIKTLAEHDLVDEYRLVVYPLVLGTGKKLFSDGFALTRLTLVDTRSLPSGVVVNTYRRSNPR
jgi:hypothetical protein